MKPLDSMDFDALQYTKQGFKTMDELAASNNVEQLTKQTLQSVQALQTPTAQGFMPKHVTLPIFDRKDGALQFFLVIENERRGPFSRSEIDGLLSSGQIDYKTLAWATGMDSWSTLQACLQFVQQK